MKFILALILSIVLVMGVSCGGGKKKAQDLQEIKTATAERGTVERTALFTGNIDAQDAAEVFPRGSGRVSKKLLKEGDPVKKGQSILLIDRDEIGFTFKPLRVDSPMDGYVGSIKVDVGSFVHDRNMGSSTEPVAVVVRPGAMRVKLDVPERYLSVILPGTKVSLIVDSMGNETFDGEIVTSSPVVDPKTRTARVEVTLPNTDGKLRHGMFGRLNLVVERKADVITIPIDSVSWEGDKQFVYKLEGDKVKRLEIKTGLRNGVKVEVLEGLSENDVLANGDLLDLKDGEAVKVIEDKKEGSEDAPNSGLGD